MRIICQKKRLIHKYEIGDCERGIFLFSVTLLYLISAILYGLCTKKKEVALIKPTHLKVKMSRQLDCKILERIVIKVVAEMALNFLFQCLLKFRKQKNSTRF